MRKQPSKFLNRSGTKVDVQPQQMGNIDRRVENLDLGSKVTVQTQKDMCRLICSSTSKV